MRLFLIVASLIATTLAQRIAIGFPADRTTISPGDSITVEVDRPNTLSSSEEISIAIGLVSCTGSCADFDPMTTLGTVPYAGAYKPELHERTKPPYQNFTVTVPDTLPTGEASLSVAHFSLIGAGRAPFMEVQNVTLIVQ